MNYKDSNNIDTLPTDPNMLESDVLKMYILPNKEKVSEEEFQTRAAELLSEYNFALEQKMIRSEIEASISELIDQIDLKLEQEGEKFGIESNNEASTYVLEYIRQIDYHYSKYPVYSPTMIAEYLTSFPVLLRVKIANYLLDMYPLETVGFLSDQLSLFPSEICEQMAYKLLEIDPNKSARGLIENFNLYPQESRERILNVFLEEIPKEFLGQIIWYLNAFDEDIRITIINRLLEKAPSEVAVDVATYIPFLDEEDREQIVYQLIQKVPREAGIYIVKDIRRLPEKIRAEIVYYLLEKAPHETATEIVSSLRFFTKEEQEIITLLLFDIAPLESIPQILFSGIKLPENLERFILDHLLDNVTSVSQVDVVQMSNHLPENLRKRIIATLNDCLFDKLIKESVANIEKIFNTLPEHILALLASKLLKNPSYEIAILLIQNLANMPKEYGSKDKDTLLRFVEKLERKYLIDSELLNPTLYRDVSQKTHFFRRDFPKTGNTKLLGGSLLNNAILRIVPTEAYLSWFKAYSSPKIWEQYGFDYVPLEPILLAHVANDKNETRVYAGVLGVNVHQYLHMHSTKRHHRNVLKQVRTIEKVLHKMNILHGHPHNGNFCILHQRTQEGDIDWNKPPRVYCIDFDASTSDS